MQKSKIEWTDYTINPVKGLCPVGCSYCYARRMYKRFKWNPEIRYDDWVWQEGCNIPTGSKTFVGSTIDLFHDKTIQFLPIIMDYVESCPKHTFIFLTKCPENLPKVFSDNCWVGISTTGNDCRSGLEDIFATIHAKVKFVSIEPLLDYAPMDFRWVNWVIIGQQTPLSAKTTPYLSWVYHIVNSCDELKVPVFLKNNLKSILPPITPFVKLNATEFSFRQEYPNVR